MAEEEKPARKKLENPDKNRIYAFPGAHVMTIIYQDIFHLKSLYILIFEWLKEEGWTSCQGSWEGLKDGEPGKGNDQFETLFYDNRTTGNKKMWIWWRVQKASGNNYYHYFMNINFMFLGWNDVDSMYDGIKYKAQQGELSIFIKPWFEYDYGRRWEKHPFLKYVHSLFKSRVFKEDILTREELLLRDTYRLQGTIKKFLEQKRFIPESEILYDAKRKFG